MNKKQHLQHMGIDVWQLKSAVSPATSDDSQSLDMSHSSSSTLNWSDLEQQVKNCKLCDLHRSRTQVVFGVGDKHAKIMFIGEAPGANEDLQGEPFVGKAGMLLTAMLQAIGLKRSEVYIANILKCRPPENRDPLPHEVKLCTPYLQQQINLVQPRILVAVGRIAAQFLLNTTEAIGRLRGKTYQYGTGKTPLLVTFHPAYLLRSPREKKVAYQDFLVIKSMAQSI